VLIVVFLLGGVVPRPVYPTGAGVDQPAQFTLATSSSVTGQISGETILNSSDVLKDRYSSLRRGMAVARKSSAAKSLLDPPAAMAIVSS
jgi:hypothetical protein